MTTKRFLEAVRYATFMHRNQRRKAANRTQVPYILHPLETAQILLEANPAISEDALIAAVLHDVLEDCRQNGACEDDIRNMFGQDVLDAVLENTDDPKLDRDAQKRMQIVNASKKLYTAAMVKAADKTSNMRDLVRVPPGWPAHIIRSYVQHAREVVAQLIITDPMRALFWKASQDALDAAAEMEAKDGNQ